MQSRFMAAIHSDIPSHMLPIPPVYASCLSESASDQDRSASDPLLTLGCRLFTAPYRGEAALTRTAKSLKAEGDKITEEVGDIGARI